MSRVFLPDQPEKVKKRVQEQLNRRARLISNMHRFAKEIKASDCAGISGQGQKVQYTHQHNSMKQKGGHAPKDYTAVEMLVDLQKALEAKSYEEAMPLYFGLRRMLGWDQ